MKPRSVQSVKHFLHDRAGFLFSDAALQAKITPLEFRYMILKSFS